MSIRTSTARFLRFLADEIDVPSATDGGGVRLEAGELPWLERPASLLGGQLELAPGIVWEEEAESQWPQAGGLYL